MAKLISKTYGDALFSVATESGNIDSFLESAMGVSKAFSENEDLVKLMNHPKVTKEEKAELLSNCFKGKIEDELLGTMLLMVTKDRFLEIDEVLSYFITRVKEYKNIGLATVTSARTLTDA
ncbi:MAG: ATP synthase F1 subunit delta, partial [Lachnospiraceae bacterium]|nr:ATP synthase F1 subunit delta [Lachnospiraceae bacterium]